MTRKEIIKYWIATAEEDLGTKKNKRIILQKVQTYITILKENNIKLKKVYLYGSFAKNKYNKDSDIDIAVVADGLTGNIIDDQFKLLVLRRPIDVRIEPYPFLSKEFNLINPFVQEIVTTGIRVY